MNWKKEHGKNGSKKLTNSGVIMKSAGLKTIKLNKPNKKRGFPFMETLSVKASAREWSDRDLNLQDISDLLWAANGINRPDEKKYTQYLRKLMVRPA
jgi:hypothetical protein